MGPLLWLWLDPLRCLQLLLLLQLLLWRFWCLGLWHLVASLLVWGLASFPAIAFDLCVCGSLVVFVFQADPQDCFCLGFLACCGGLTCETDGLLRQASGGFAGRALQVGATQLDHCCG